MRQCGAAEAASGEPHKGLLDLQASIGTGYSTAPIHQHRDSSLGGGSAVLTLTVNNLDAAKLQFANSSNFQNARSTTFQRYFSKSHR
jgi:hypothetical protein